MALKISELKLKLAEQGEQGAEWARRVEVMEGVQRRLEQGHVEKVREQKYFIQELQLKLKHAESKALLKEEQFLRLMEERDSKREQELEQAKLEFQRQLESVQEKDQLALQSLKDYQEAEIQMLKEKLQELRNANRIKELEIMELRQAKIGSEGNQMELLEGIHMQYLEEIKGLNETLRLFTSQKDAEVRRLSLDLEHKAAQVFALEASLASQQERYSKLEQELGQRVQSYKRRLEKLFRSVGDFEKCQTLVAAQAKRIEELKQRVRMLEDKDKWQWRSLSKKALDSEKKLQYQRKSSQRGGILQKSSEEGCPSEVQLRMRGVKGEVEEVQRQQEGLREKLEEVSKEARELKKDRLSPRSVSPRLISSSNGMLSFESGVQKSEWEMSSRVVNEGKQMFKQNTAKNLQSMMKQITAYKYQQDAVSTFSNENNLSSDFSWPHLKAKGSTKKASVQGLEECPKQLHKYITKDPVNSNRNKNKINSMFVKPKLSSHHNKQYSSSVLTQSSLMSRRAPQKKAADTSHEFSSSIRTPQAEEFATKETEAALLRTQKNLKGELGKELATTMQTPQSCFENRVKATFKKIEEDMRESFVYQQHQQQQQQQRVKKIKRSPRLELPEQSLSRLHSKLKSPSRPAAKSTYRGALKSPVGSSSSSQPVLISSLSQQKRVYGDEEERRIEEEEQNVEDDLVNFENLEEENERLMNNLKKAKIDLAVFQERSSSTELSLKKEIFKLQLQLAQNQHDSPNKMDMSPSAAPKCFQSFQKMDHHPFTPPHFMSNKQVNFASTQNNFLFGQTVRASEMNSNPFSAKKLQQIPKKDLQGTKLSLDMKTPQKKDISESLLSLNDEDDSPSAFQIGDEIAPCSNKLEVNTNDLPSLKSLCK